MKNEYNVNLSKEECMNQALDVLENGEGATIKRKTETSIKFKRGSIWSFETSSDNTQIIGTINFEENGQTKITGQLNNHDLLLQDIIVNVFLTLIFLTIITTLFPYLRDLQYLEYLNGQISYNTFLVMFNVWNAATIFMVILTPSLFLINGLYSYLYLKRKGLKSIIKNIYTRLSSLVKEKHEKQQSQSESKEIIIRDRVKVIYDLPEKCPSCFAPLKYESIKMRGPTKAECTYCNSMFNLIEKEI